MDLYAGLLIDSKHESARDDSLPDWAVAWHFRKNMTDLAREWRSLGEPYNYIAKFYSIKSMH